MSAFKLIVFDYDGTLFDTRPAIVHCLRRAFEDCGRTIPAGDTAASVVGNGLPLGDTLLLLDSSLRHDRTALNELVITYRKLYRNEAAPLLRRFPGAPEALQQLHANGATCLVVSNKGVKAIHRSLDESGLSGMVDLVLGDQPGMPCKPDPTVVTDVILPRFPAVQRGQILMVGDTEVDILFARRAKVSCCWVSSGYGDAQRCRALAPDYEISGLFGLAALMRDRPPARSRGP
jgi:phosphoglycolate phosphatase